MDKEYIVLNEIGRNSKVTQRELAEKIHCSVGSINILLNKMINEGLIEIERIKMNRIIYMLTPTGIVERLQKTSNYIKSNYNYIMNTQTQIRKELENLVSQHGEIFVLLEEDEISSLVKNSIKDNEYIKFITCSDTCDKSKTVVVLSINNYNKFKEKYKDLINILELI